MSIVSNAAAIAAGGGSGGGGGGSTDLTSVVSAINSNAAKVSSNMSSISVN